MSIDQTTRFDELERLALNSRTDPSDREQYFREAVREFERLVSSEKDGDKRKGHMKRYYALNAAWKARPANGTSEQGIGVQPLLQEIGRGDESPALQEAEPNQPPEPNPALQAVNATQAVLNELAHQNAVVRPVLQPKGSRHNPVRWYPKDVHSILTDPRYEDMKDCHYGWIDLLEHRAVMNEGRLPYDIPRLAKWAHASPKRFQRDFHIVLRFFVATGDGSELEHPELRKHWIETFAEIERKREIGRKGGQARRQPPPPVTGENEDERVTK